MAKRRQFDPSELKRIAIKAMFSDDELLERLVLKGGNLLDIVFGISTRASVDLDFSIEGEFETVEWLQRRVEAVLTQAFAEIDVVVFDVTVAEVPKTLLPATIGYWGGYQITFKIIERAIYNAYSRTLDDVRRRAIAIGAGNSTKFEIDISKFEYCGDKQQLELDHLTIYAYSPVMVICEKLRAICQQMPEYAAIVGKNSSPRARDFVDICTLLDTQAVDLASAEVSDCLQKVFAAKRVPLSSLRRIREYREFHRADFPAVQATTKRHVALADFDRYFDRVVKAVEALKAFGDE